MKKTLVAALLCSASVVGVSAGSAFAGEVTGQNRGTPLQAGAGPAERVGKAVVNPSHCAFSGLEDFDGAAPVQPGVTQTPKGAGGSLVSLLCKGPHDGNVDKP